MLNIFKKHSTLDASIERGREAGAILREQGITDENVSGNMLEHIARENNLEPMAFAFGVDITLNDWSYCFTCRCSQPANHECI